MWDQEKSMKLIYEITQKYGSEIAIDGSNLVLGLEEHLDHIVAKLMKLDLEIVKVAKHQRAIIKRAAITESIDKVISLLEYKVEKEEDLTREKTEIKKILMKVEVEIQELTSNPNISSTMAVSDIDTKDILISKAKKITTKAIVIEQIYS